MAGSARSHTRWCSVRWRQLWGASGVSFRYCSASTALTATASLGRLQVRHWALVATAAGASATAGTPGVGGVILGGTIIGLSVLLYAIGLGALLRRSGPRLAIGLLFVKLLAFLGLGWLAFAAGRAYRPDPIGFALGLTCFPAAAVWEALRQGRS